MVHAKTTKYILYAVTSIVISQLIRFVPALWYKFGAIASFASNVAIVVALLALVLVFLDTDNWKELREHGFAYFKLVVSEELERLQKQQDITKVNTEEKRTVQSSVSTEIDTEIPKLELRKFKAEESSVQEKPVIKMEFTQWTNTLVGLTDKQIEDEYERITGNKLTPASLSMIKEKISAPGLNDESLKKDLW